MFKKISIAALAAISLSAFAQDSDYGHWMEKGDINVAGKSNFELRKRIDRQASECLSFADQYDLDAMLNQNSDEIDTALLRGLCHAHRQAAVITDHMLAMRFPEDSTTYATTTTNGNTVTTTTTTTTLQANNIDWSSEDHSSRPLRIIMTNPIRPKDLSYDDAISVLCSNLNATESSILSGWWYGEDNRDGATERMKDVIVRLLKDDARMADQTYYPSVYMHRTSGWTNSNQ
jgi:hypothetical protein